VTLSSTTSAGGWFDLNAVANDEASWFNSNVSISASYDDTSWTLATVGNVQLLSDWLSTAVTFTFDDLIKPFETAATLENSLNHRQQPLRALYKEREFENVSPAEVVALQLLRKMVSQENFRRYLRYGFVPVRGASGLVYQIHRRDRITVWDRGEEVARLCVHLRGQNMPPTDEVVGKILIVECDEKEIWRKSNITWRTSRRDRKTLEAVQQAA
jgi:hypothetical protein